jgi:hypothetical protein
MTMQDYEKVGGLLVPVKDSAKGSGLYTGTIIKGGYFDDDGVWHRGKNIVDHFEFENIVVDQGLTSMLGVYLHADTQIANWFCGLFEGNYTPVGTVTAATIASASTETTAYTSATRVAYVPAAAAAKAITNAASRADFIFNATKTLYGAFLISDSTKSGTAGTLFSVARFGSSKVVNDTDELLLTYAYALSSS